MDEQRVENLARALCRAARMDPDKPLPQASFTMMLDQPGTRWQQRNWTLFRQEAVRALSREGATAS